MLKNFCFLDLETTGFEPKKDSIIEVSFLRKENGKEVERFDHVFLPDKSLLTPFVSSLTGITEDELNKTGKKLSDEIHIINEKIGDSIIVGHNIDFDIRFLVENGVDIAQNPRIDTHELARILLPGEESFALEILSKKYGFIHEEAHRAMSDVEASEDLFEMLLKKIEQLPSAFLTAMQPFLTEKTEWYAKQLFLEAQGDPTRTPGKREGEKGMSAESPEAYQYQGLAEWEEKYAECTKEKSVFWRIGDSVTSAQATVSAAQKISEKEDVLIISLKLGFFKDVCMFPTPEVLLDPARLEGFTEKRELLDDLETTFYVKAKYRQFLGFRGQDAFDIFFKERDYWEEVQVQEVEHPVYQEVLAGRKKEKIMVLTPRAFLRFHDLELFKDRVLLIDEAEFFVSELLNAPTKNYSLYPFLESSDESVANRALFYVSHFCKEVIEKKIGHAIGPFPERVLLSPTEKLDSFAESLRAIAPESHDLQAAATILAQPEKGLVRWIAYFPENGNLSIYAWAFDEWERLKQVLNHFKKVVLYRHKQTALGELFKTFLGSEEALFFEDESLRAPKKLVIPNDLVSANSPGFNHFCGEQIVEIYKKELGSKGSLVVNFSSLETLRGIYDQVTARLEQTDVAVVGEKVNGGDGKVLEILKTKKNVIFFTQKMLHPALAQREWGAVVMQKFPFLAPSPLMETVERSMKTQGKNFWAAWIIPQVAANLSRRIANYPSAKKFIFLDPRENSRWGKDILKQAL